MDPISVIVMSLVNGIIAAAAQEIGRDAYLALRRYIASRYSAVNIDQLERSPRSKRQQQIVEDQLRQAGAAEDAQLLALAEQLLDDVRQAPIYDANNDDNGRPASQMDIEAAESDAGFQVVGQVVDGHIATLVEVRSKYPVDDAELFSSSIASNNTLPEAVRADIGGLHHKIRSIVLQAATRIEQRKYRSAEAAIAEMRLAHRQQQSAMNLLRAEKKIHVSFQTLKLVVSYFSSLNSRIIDRIRSAQSIQSETNLLFGNAVLVYELTDFVINYIEGFSLSGVQEIHAIHRQYVARFEKMRANLAALQQQAQSEEIEPSVRDIALQNIDARTKSLAELEKEWQDYMEGIETLHGQVEVIRGKLPTLNLIRSDAKNQIEFLEAIAIMQILKQSAGALATAVILLESIRLISLNPNRVRRLLNIH